MAALTAGIAATWPKLVASVTVMVRSREVAEDLAGGCDGARLRAMGLTAPSNSRRRGCTGWPSTWCASIDDHHLLEMRFPRRGIEEIARTPDVDESIWQAVAVAPGVLNATAIVSRYLADLTQQDVATAMEVSPETAAASHVGCWACCGNRKTLGEDFLEVDE